MSSTKSGMYQICKYLLNDNYLLENDYYPIYRYDWISISTEDDKEIDNCIGYLPYILDTYLGANFNANVYLGGYQIFQVILPKVNYFAPDRIVFKNWEVG